MRRIGTRFLLGVLLLLVLLLGAAVSLLTTQGGSRWLLEQVPGLHVEGWQGALLSEWRAEQLHWQQDDLSVKLNTVHMQFRLSCVLRSALCIDQLSVQRLELNLPDSEPDSEPPQVIELPDLKLPGSLEVQQLFIGELLLNGESLLNQAHLNAHWAKHAIQLAKLDVQYQEYRLQASGTVTARGQWPLQLQLDAHVPIPDAQALEIHAQLTGSVHKLVLQANTQGYLVANLDGQLLPLAADLPAQLSIQAAEFIATADLPERLTLADLDIQLHGDLDKGYQLAGQAVLAKTPEQMRLNLSARVDSAGALLESLHLAASEEQFVALQGSVDWHADLQAEAQLQWQSFPWYSLLAQEDIAVQLQHLSAQLNYNAGDYQGRLDSSLTGPAGDFTLSSAFSGDLQQVHLNELLLEAGQGQLQGAATLGFADGLDWLADIQVSQLNPAYWVAELPGELAGRLHSQGQLLAGELQVDADVDLNGRLRGSPAQFKAQLQGSQPAETAGLWQLRHVELRFGDNRVSGHGQLDQALVAQLDIELPRLVQLWPGLAGEASGAVRVSGSLVEPLAQLQLQGKGIAYQGHRVGAFNLTGQLLPEQHGQLRLDAERIWTGDTELGVLHLAGEGTLAAHQGQLSVTGPLLETQLELAGGLDKGNWLAQIKQLLIDSHQQHWALAEPTAVRYLHNGELHLGAHCLRSGASSLCAAEQQLLPQPKINYQLRDFPLATLQPWLPADAQLEGLLNGTVQLAISDQGPRGNISLDAGQGQLRVRHEQQWEVFAWQTLQLKSELTAKAIQSKLQLTGAESGHLELRANLDPRTQDHKLSGQFLIEQVDLSVLRPFISQVAVLEGQLAGRGSLSGTLLAPRINGYVQLREGQISGGDLPTPIEQLQLRADIQGERMLLNGGWRSGEQGAAVISGDLNWAKQLLVDVDIKGQHLPVLVEPYANLEIAPDLQISLKEQRLFISGEVAVPKGNIRIPQLPEQAVRISSDARVVGQAEPEPGLQVGMDIMLNVGADKLHFSAFGLDADLRGHLQVGDNLAGRGLLELLNGRYRAYGQRLQLRRARLLFAGPLSQPFLDIEAVRVTGDVTAGLRLSGPAAQPQSEIFSQPAMSQEQALSWLLLGRPLQGGEGDGNAMAQAALALGLMGTAPITNKVAEVFGVQDFTLDSEGSGLTSSVVATGRISEKISLRYGVGVFEPASSLALRYELSRRMYLEAASGLANSLDIFYKRDF